MQRTVYSMSLYRILQLLQIAEILNSSAASGLHWLRFPMWVGLIWFVILTFHSGLVLQKYQDNAVIFGSCFLALTWQCFDLVVLCTSTCFNLRRKFLHCVNLSCTSWSNRSDWCNLVLHFMTKFNAFTWDNMCTVTGIGGFLCYFLAIRTSTRWRKCLDK